MSAACTASFCTDYRKTFYVIIVSSPGSLYWSASVLYWVQPHSWSRWLVSTLENHGQRRDWWPGTRQVKPDVLDLPAYRRKLVSRRSNQIITLNNLPTLRALLVTRILARLDLGPKAIDRFYLEAFLYDLGTLSPSVLDLCWKHFFHFPFLDSV